MIYGYLRVSTDQQDVENQKSGIVNFATQKIMQVDDWIVDDGVSGVKEPEKRQLGILMAKCKKGDIIICSELSRLGRKMLMVMSILEHCMKNGIMVYTVKDNYILGDNIQSQVLAFAFSLASQIERDMIALRTKEALDHKKSIGVLLGNSRGPRKNEYVTSVHIEKMKCLLEKGKSLSAIATEMKMHRLTVGYHLAINGLWEGQIEGYNLTYANGNSIKLTKRNCVEYGLYYKHIQDAVLKGKDLSMIGIVKVEPIKKAISVQIRDYFNVSDHPMINHQEVERYILEGLTLPEIHNRLGSIVDYNTVYEYVQNDTDLSNKYRANGHKKVKSKRERW